VTILKDPLLHDLVMTAPAVSVQVQSEAGHGPQTRSLLAQMVLTLTQVALAAPDLPSGITPTLEHLVNDTAAVGAAYFQAAGDHALTYQVRAASGDMPSTPGMAAIAAHGLPADVPLMRALESTSQALFFDDCQTAAETQGFIDLGVASLAAAPVRRADGRLIGAFLMHTFERHIWSDSEAALFSMVSGTIAALAGRLAAEEQIRAAQEASLRALGLALEARDGETLGHTDRVTSFALRLAGQLDLNDEQIQALRWGAYLHDVGKIAIPDAVLLKPGKLTPHEWSVMQSHVTAGTSFAAALEFLPSAALAVIAQHHERWEGGGYPWGMVGSEISLCARIFALCDVYDALTSERPYKVAWSREEALAEIQAQSGKHFDPELVPHFIEMARSLDH
jgi:putative nucleotidyltransferase with HDIG domain